MSYVRIYEDHGMNIDAKHNNSSIFISSDYFKPVIFSCDYCDAYFYSEEELFTHIKEIHKLDAILMIDNKVKTNVENIYLSNVSTALIYTYSINVNIKIDDVTISAEKRIDITKIINDKLTQNGKCIIILGSKTIKLYKYSINLGNESIINEIIDTWSNNCELKKALIKNYPKILNESEIRFLDGCFNYFLACNADGDDKKKRYDDASKILSDFYTLNSIGNTILKIIYFRRNWFSKLEQICFNNNSYDDFDIIIAVFNDKNFITNFASQNQIGELFIEDDIKNSIESFVNYINGNNDEVELYLRSNENYEVLDTNLRDRVLFLKGLVESKKGRIRRANNLAKDITNEIIQQKLKRILEKQNG